MRWIPLLLMFVLVGCKTRDKAEVGKLPINEEKYDMMVQILLDTSGSYRDKLQAKAYPFTFHTIDTMFRNRMGANDRVMLAQISGTREPMMFDGNPRALQSQYPSASGFTQALMNRPDPGGSRVFDSISDATERLLNQAGVREKKTKVALIILSDMDNNICDVSPEKSKERLLKALKELAKCDSCVGIYWCDSHLMGEWSGHLRDAGFGGRMVIEDKFRADPPCPTFE